MGEKNCDSCNATGDDKGGVEWRATHDTYLCAKCNHEQGSNAGAGGAARGSSVSKSGGLNGGGLRR